MTQIDVKVEERRRSQRGSAVVESAISLTVFLMLFFGIIEFGRATFAYNQMSFLAAQGARWASVRGSTVPVQATSASVQSYVQGLAVGLDTSKMTVSTTWQNGSNTPGNWVKVKVLLPTSFIAPYMPVDFNLGAASQQIILR